MIRRPVCVFLAEPAPLPVPLEPSVENGPCHCHNYRSKRGDDRHRDFGLQRLKGPYRRPREQDDPCHADGNEDQTQRDLPPARTGRPFKIRHSGHLLKSSDILAWEPADHVGRQRQPWRTHSPSRCSQRLEQVWTGPNVVSIVNGQPTWSPSCQGPARGLGLPQSTRR